MNIKDLNPKQLEAVKTTEGPVLILAGAGSGKTRALTYRLAYLIENKKIAPEHILAVTFTNKAAQEMKERISQLIISQIGPMSPIGPIGLILPWLGTFHSVCAKILRREISHLGYAGNFIIYDESDSLHTIKAAMKELGIDPKKNNPNAIKIYISGAKNELMTPNDYSKVSDSYFQEVAAKIYHLYQKKLKESNAVDFDDLLMLTVRIFKQFPEVLKKYQSLFKYILIDEYQDTNYVQYILVKLLAEKHKNICVVGDDWQAIYAFRGANFRNILNFERDYPEAKVIRLEQNYRSTKSIIGAAQELIKNNNQRTEKNLWTQNQEGLPITLYQAMDEKDEAEFVAQEIQSLRKFHKLSDFVILYRTNAQSRIFEEIMLKHNIPYRIIGALRFYERREIKDIIAYLRLILNSRDKVSLARIINVPSRGIGAKSLDKYLRESIENEKIKQFLVLMEDLRVRSKKLSLLELLDYILEKSGYKNWILDGTPEGENRWENIKELKSVMSEFISLEEFLEKVALISDIDNYESGYDAVNIMTLHNAKGLEFSVVFISGMEEGLFPHSRSLDNPIDLEEERRLCYVGMTRAKERLYLLYADSRLVFGSRQFRCPSRFISELPDYLVDKL